MKLHNIIPVTRVTLIGGEGKIFLGIRLKKIKERGVKRMTVNIHPYSVFTITPHFNSISFYTFRNEHGKRVARHLANLGSYDPLRLIDSFDSPFMPKDHDLFLNQLGEVCKVLYKINGACL